MKPPISPHKKTHLFYPNFPLKTHNKKLNMAQLRRNQNRGNPQSQNIDIDIPRDKLVVITGLSGSGQILA